MTTTLTDRTDNSDAPPPSLVVANGDALKPLPEPKKHKGRVSYYSNRELLKWLLNRDMLLLTIPWWAEFEQQNEDIREWLRQAGRVAPHTGSRNFSKEKEFWLYARIPTNIAQVMISCDGDLDGSDDIKMDQFLKDHPVFDLRIRSPK